MKNKLGGGTEWVSASMLRLDNNNITHTQTEKCENAHEQNFSILFVYHSYALAQK